MKALLLFLLTLPAHASPSCQAPLFRFGEPCQYKNNPWMGPVCTRYPADSAEVTIEQDGGRGTATVTYQGKTQSAPCTPEENQDYAFSCSGGDVSILGYSTGKLIVYVGTVEGSAETCF